MLVEKTCRKEEESKRRKKEVRKKEGREGESSIAKRKEEIVKISNKEKDRTEIHREGREKYKARTGRIKEEGTIEKEKERK